MKRLMVTVPVLCLSLLFTPIQIQILHAQSPEATQKLEQLAKQLKLTPQQKLQIAPILESEAPKIKAITGDPGLSKVQKMEQLKGVHDQTDPQMKSILTPEQYQKLQEIRQKDAEQALKKRHL
jgi:protein CpxP